MFEIFLPYGSMLREKIVKKKHQKLNDPESKIGQEICCIGNYHQNLELIHFTVSGKMMSTVGDEDDRRRTTDARAMTVALLCSSTKQS